MIKQIQADIKSAMIDKDVVRKDVLKMVVNRAKMTALDLREETPSEQMVIDAIKKEIKQLNESISILEEKNKTDCNLYNETKRKIEILMEYIPAQLTENELREQILQFITENNVNTSKFGLVMKEVMPAFKNKADGESINKITKELFDKVLPFV